ncbi:EamA family transporter [Algihabitans albus]|uniref:EamA family transporter n=1 Tax=Algihabitans albus TaxID=2164067 RepID=UPI000E5CC6B8|nr:EamA family transporter [Algihabitans albus]
MYGLLLVFCSALFLAGGQIVFKLVSTRMEGDGFSGGIFQFALHALSQPYIWIGGGLAAGGFAIYVYGLRLVDLSRGAPIAGGLIIVLTVLLSGLLLREQIGLTRGIGIAAIVIGIALVSRS